MNYNAPGSVSNYKWVMLALTWLVYFTFGMILMSIPTLITPIVDELTLTYYQIGLILGIWPLLYAVLAVLIGLFIDRVGARRSIMVGIVLVSLSGLLRSFATNFETLFLFVFLFGLGGPIISVGLPKIVASWFSSKERGAASGIYITGAFVGNATTLAITNAIVMPVVGTWRNTLAVYGLLGFVIAFIWLLFGKDSPHTQIGDVTAVPLREAIARLLGERYVWIIAIIGFSHFFAAQGFGNWLQKFLELKGMSPAEAGVLTSVPGWCGLIGSVVIPRLRKAGSRKPLVFVTMLVAGICIFSTGISSGLPLIISLVFYGISYATVPLLMLILMDMPQVGAEYMGAAGGIFFSLGGLGGFIGPYMVGFLVDLTGSILPSIIALTAVVESMLIFAFLMKEK